MKKILLLLILQISLISYSQVNDTIPAIEPDKITTTERIIDKYSGKIYDLIKEMAESLSVPAEYVWKVLVRQAIVDSITYTLLLIIGSYFMFLLYKFFSKTVKKWGGILNDTPLNENDVDITPQMIMKIILGIVGVIIFIFGIVHTSDIVQGIINPEYKAIQMIIDALN